MTPLPVSARNLLLPGADVVTANGIVVLSLPPAVASAVMVIVPLAPPENVAVPMGVFGPQLNWYVLPPAFSRYRYRWIVAPFPLLPEASKITSRRTGAGSVLATAVGPVRGGGGGGGGGGPGGGGG